MAEERTTESVLVGAPIERVYEYWCNPENLPRLLTNVEQVRATGPLTSRWVVKGPLGTKIEFDVRIIRDRPNSTIAWAAEGGQLNFWGEVRVEELAPNVTRVEFSAGPAAPRRSLKDALRKLRRILEAEPPASLVASESRTSEAFLFSLPIAVRGGRRKPGSFAGRLVAGEDFDEPLPDDVLRRLG